MSPNDPLPIFSPTRYILQGGTRKQGQYRVSYMQKSLENIHDARLGAERARRNQRRQECGSTYLPTIGHSARKSGAAGCVAIAEANVKGAVR